jgi:hypothetical protein
MINNANTNVPTTERSPVELILFTRQAVNASSVATIEVRIAQYYSSN